MNYFDHLRASFCPSYPRKVPEAKMARLFPLKALTFEERKYRHKSKGLWPNIQQAEKEKVLSDVNTFILASYHQTAVTGSR